MRFAHDFFPWFFEWIAAWIADYVLLLALLGEPRYTLRTRSPAGGRNGKPGSSPLCSLSPLHSPLFKFAGNRGEPVMIARTKGCEADRTLLSGSAD